MMLIKDVRVSNGARMVRIFIYEEGSRSGIRLPVRREQIESNGAYQDFTLEETWEMANAFAAAARILETTAEHWELGEVAEREKKQPLTCPCKPGEKHTYCDKAGGLI